MAQLKSNIIEEENINTAKEMNKILKHDVKKILKEDEKLGDELNLTYAKDVLPQHDIHTDVPSEVYERSSIIPKVIQEEIKFKALYDALKETDEIDQELFNTYERMCVYEMRYLINEKNKFAQHSTKEKKVRPPHLRFRMRAVIYLTYLLRLYRSQYTIRMTQKELSEHLDIPVEILSHILSEYSSINTGEGDGNKKFYYSRSKKLQDKLLCHIIVLLLIIRDYSFDIKHILKALNLEFPKLVAYLRMLSIFPKKMPRLEKTKEEEGEGDGEEKKRKKNEWALDKNGSLMVELRAPMRLQRPKDN